MISTSITKLNLNFTKIELTLKVNCLITASPQTIYQSWTYHEVNIVEKRIYHKPEASELLSKTAMLQKLLPVNGCEKNINDWWKVIFLYYLYIKKNNCMGLINLKACDMFSSRTKLIKEVMKLETSILYLVVGL